MLSNEVYKTCFKVLPTNASPDEFKKCMGNYIQSYEVIQEAFEQYFKKPKFTWIYFKLIYILLLIQSIIQSYILLPNLVFVHQLDWVIILILRCIPEKIAFIFSIWQESYFFWQTTITEFIPIVVSSFLDLISEISLKMFLEWFLSF